MQQVKKILLLVFFVLLGHFFYSENWQDFSVQKDEYIQVFNEKKTQLKDFSFDHISKTLGDEIYFTPDKKFLEKLVQKIDKAEKKVYVNTYIFTEKRMRDALLMAKKRGVDVKVILEKNVYKSPHLNDGTYKIFQSGGVDVVWSDATDYSLNHAKYMVFDNDVLVSTGNHSYSTFTTNRDIFVQISDQSFVQGLQKIFLRDFSHEKNFIYLDSLILSSFDAREKFSFFLTHANKKVQMYVPYIDDEQILEELIHLAKKGVVVEIVTSDKNISVSWAEVLQSVGVKIRFLKLNIHAKAIFIDSQFLYIGSTNFSFPSIEKNREVGILTQNEKITQIFKKHFEDDFIN